MCREGDSSRALTMLERAIDSLLACREGCHLRCDCTRSCHDCDHASHICTGTELTPATSAPGLGCAQDLPCADFVLNRREHVRRSLHVDVPSLLQHNMSQRRLQHVATKRTPPARKEFIISILIGIMISIIARWHRHCHHRHHRFHDNEMLTHLRVA